MKLWGNCLKTPSSLEVFRRAFHTRPERWVPEKMRWKSRGPAVRVHERGGHAFFAGADLEDQHGRPLDAVVFEPDEGLIGLLHRK